MLGVMRRLALAVALALPLACTPRRDPAREALMRVNVAAGVLEPGRWGGTLIATPPPPASMLPAEYALQVDVTPVRDSALLMLTVEVPTGSRLHPIDATLRTDAGGPTGRFRYQPIDLRVEGNALHFRLYRIFGWEAVDCTLVRDGEDSPLSGSCEEVGSRFRPLRLVLAVPAAKAPPR